MLLSVYQNDNKCLVSLSAIGGGLCGFSQFDGPIPINKNLWTFSFVCVMAGWGFWVLGILYFIIDQEISSNPSIRPDKIRDPSI